MEKVIFSIGVFFFALPSFAGGVSDGGGNAILCRNNDQLTSAEVFDLYEARNLYNFPVRNLDAKDPLDSALSVAKLIDEGGAGTDPSIVANGSMRFDPSTAANTDFTQTYVRYVHQNMQVLAPGVVLKPIDDSNSQILPPANCELAQLARYNDQYDKILVSGDIWNVLSNTNRAALLAHEALYKKLRMNGERTSERARAAVGAGFAGHQLRNIADGVPNNPWLCWTPQDDSAYRFAIYKEKDDAVFQFFRLAGKVPLTKTTIRMDFNDSPLSTHFRGGLSAEATIQDSLLDRGYKIHWGMSKDYDGKVIMNIGGGNDTFSVTCAKPPPDNVPWPWDLNYGEVRYNERGTYLIDSDTVSCYQQTSSPGSTIIKDVPAMYFSLNSFEIEWDDTNSDLYVAEIAVEARAPGVMSYSGIIAGNELASLNLTHGQWNGIIPRARGGKNSVFQSKCSLKFGGLGGWDPKKPFVAEGFIKVKGFSRDDQGNEKPVSIENKRLKIYFEP